jgi:DNA-binding CsgD family transcriptional regulator
MLDTTLSRLVGGIYDAVIDPILWSGALDAIRREFHFHLAVLGVNKMPSGETAFYATCNVPDEYLRTLGQYGEDVLEAWGGLAAVARLPLEEPIVLTQTRALHLWQKNRFYLEWVKPQGIVDQVAMVLANDRTANGNVGFSCHETRGPVEPETIADLRLLAPHLRRAVNIGRLLDMTTNAAATFEAALAAMASAAVLVNADMKIVYANPVAQRMLHDADPIRAQNGKLELIKVLVPGQLEAAVEAAAEPEVNFGRRGIGIPTRKRDGTPLVLHVLPLEQRSPRTGAPWKSVAAVFIADTGGQAAIPIDALSLLFELTPMEARVLELTVAGHSSREVAEALGVAPSTVKTHTLNLYEKTGRHRREDLVRQANEVSLPR